MTLSAVPLRDYHHPCTGYNWSDTYKSYLDSATTVDCHIYIYIYCQWIPAHVGIGPNEEANDVAGLCADTYSADTQNTTIPIELKAFKSTLKQHLKQQWIQHTPLLGSEHRIHFNCRRMMICLRFFLSIISCILLLELIASKS
jgi:hypothetical protein